MMSYKKDTIAILIRLKEMVKAESMTIDMGCGAGSYEFVAVEDIDYCFEKIIDEVEQ